MQINIFTNKTLKLSTPKERPLKIDLIVRQLAFA